MLFNSIEFAIFLPIVLSLYWALGHRRQNALLLIASYVFYGAWDPRFLSLIVLSTLIDHFVAQALGHTEDERRRKRLLVVSLCANLGILGAFKYFGFFVASAAGLLGRFGLSVDAPTIQILLPVGISFYTFQTISYTFDVYRRRIEPAADIFTFATYVAYFPQLVAGPIERAQNLLPQMQRERRRPDGDGMRSSLTLILIGLFKKVAVADALAPVVDRTFGGVHTMGRGALLFGVLAFALQIYGDFSGYTDIARGVSRLFGIELMRNFEQPYLSRSITEFWRTWHISLSAWLHDYLYVPLGGNRNGRWRTYRNLMLTMLLGGLWHGASWTFVVWGAAHGFFLCLHRVAGGYVARGHPAPLRWRDVPSIVTTFAIVGLLWVFFRAPSLAVALVYLQRLIWAPWGSVDPDALILVVFSLLVIGVIDVAQRVSGRHSVLVGWPAFARGAAYAFLLLLVAVWTGGAAQPFIYFQF